MAGMLPGVEAARRRRIHQRSVDGAGGGHVYTRRPVPAISAERSERKRTGEDELGGPAREAKERLDERLRSKSSSLLHRFSNERREGKAMMVTGLQAEVFGSKKKMMLLRWASRLGGKKATEALEEEEECAICLEGMKAGDTLFNLRCSHRFHSGCILPWLQSHPLCPCCRITIFP